MCNMLREKRKCTAKCLKQEHVFGRTKTNTGLSNCLKLIYSSFKNKSFFTRLMKVVSLLQMQFFTSISSSFQSFGPWYELNVASLLC